MAVWFAVCFAVCFQSVAAFLQVQLGDVEKGLEWQGLFHVDRRYFLLWCQKEFVWRIIWKPTKSFYLFKNISPSWHQRAFIFFIIVSPSSFSWRISREKKFGKIFFIFPLTKMFMWHRLVIDVTAWCGINYKVIKRSRVLKPQNSVSPVCQKVRFHQKWRCSTEPPYFSFPAWLSSHLLLHLKVLKLSMATLHVTTL